MVSTAFTAVFLVGVGVTHAHAFSAPGAGALGDAVEQTSNAVHARYYGYRGYGYGYHGYGYRGLGYGYRGYGYGYRSYAYRPWGYPGYASYYYSQPLYDSSYYDCCASSYYPSYGYGSYGYRPYYGRSWRYW
jgi:hypothetical protein